MPDWAFTAWTIVPLAYLTIGAICTIGIWLMGLRRQHRIRWVSALVMLVGYPVVIPMVLIAVRRERKADG